MTFTRQLVTLIVATLPWGVRERYREEWLADLDGAAELGIPTGAVVRGAAVTALTLDRADSATSGMPRLDLARRRGRWAAAFGSSAIILGAGTLFTGGLRSFERERIAGGAALAAVGTGLEVAAVVLGALALVFAVGAVAVGGLPMRRLAGAVLLLVAVGAAAALNPVALVMVALPVAAFLSLAVLTGEGRPAPRRLRIAVGTTIAVAALAFVALTVVRIAVWNPLARAPGLTLDQIYTEMVQANQLSPAAGTFLAAWAAVWAVVALALPIACLVPAAAGWFTLRRLAVVGCAMLGLIIATSWIAGFGIGMALADTFLTSGGDATIGGAVLTVAGQLALAATPLIALAPARPHTAAPAAVAWRAKPARATRRVRPRSSLRAARP
ncbi:hypothetical protein H9651_00490 [Microbacterium sp. Sa4CUA7]|uniref:Uncharacterized protein n=1 Tax=Microbacterium pullorum TaxID=2762236 RepID=A0ABR8RY24_9MICO|nr:hypothetical protein [Microbacterium pullorum]MBD7956116.1 hypothetical protein [Microbacterium pullorum]